jgi:ATP-dependent DNA ligase
MPLCPAAVQQRLHQVSIREAVFSAYGFVSPCLPTKTERPPSGELWLHEIKHDGFRVIARKDAAKRLLAMRIAVFELIRAPPR